MFARNIWSNLALHSMGRCLSSGRMTPPSGGSKYSGYWLIWLMIYASFWSQDTPSLLRMFSRSYRSISDSDTGVLSRTSDRNSSNSPGGKVCWQSNIGTVKSVSTWLGPSCPTTTRCSGCRDAVWPCSGTWTCPMLGVSKNFSAVVASGHCSARNLTIWASPGGAIVTWLTFTILTLWGWIIGISCRLGRFWFSAYAAICRAYPASGLDSSKPMR